MHVRAVWADKAVFGSPRIMAVAGILPAVILSAVFLFHQERTAESPVDGPNLEPAVFGEVEEMTPGFRKVGAVLAEAEVGPPGVVKMFDLAHPKIIRFLASECAQVMRNADLDLEVYEVASRIVYPKSEEVIWFESYISNQLLPFNPKEVARKWLERGPI